MVSIATFDGIGTDGRDRRLSLADTILLLMGLLIFAGTFRALLASGSDDREAGSMAFQLIVLLICGGAAASLAKGVPRWAPQLLVAAWPLLLLTGFAVLSTIWSDVPQTTARRGVALLLTTFFAVYTVLRFRLSEFIAILSLAFGVFCVVSILSAAVPGLGVTPGGLHDGAWRGLTGQKNEFGRSCGLWLTFSAAAYVFAGPRQRSRFVLSMLAAAILLILSTSKTPITATAVGLGCGFASIVLLHGRLGRLYLAAEIRLFLLLVALPLVIGLLFWAVPIIVAAMGRDLTFSGRTELWAWAIATGGDAPWFGQGYRGFWNDGNTRYFFESFAWGRTLDGELSDSFSGPTHAHSGYVDLWIELGWVGVALFAGLVVSTFSKIAYAMRLRQRAAGISLSVTLWFMLAYAFTAKSLLQQSEDLWFLFLVFYLYAARLAAERRAARIAFSDWAREPAYRPDRS